MNINWNKIYDDFTIEELMYLKERFGETIVLQDGHLVDFVKEDNN